MNPVSGPRDTSGPLGLICLNRQTLGSCLKPGIGHLQKLSGLTIMAGSDRR